MEGIHISKLPPLYAIFQNASTAVPVSLQNAAKKSLHPQMFHKPNMFIILRVTHC